MQSMQIRVGEESVSALLTCLADANALFLFAHGAGAGMTHQTMESNALGLARREVATLRYQFPYMEKGLKRPDVPNIARATVRAAAAAAVGIAPELPLFAGGRSFGGRMTSQAQAELALPGVRGLVFIGFPLHPAGKPGLDRAEHLKRVRIPMLFISGSRDALAELDLLKPVVEGLGPSAMLRVIDGADHSLKVPAKSSRTSAEAEAETLDIVAEWIRAHS